MIRTPGFRLLSILLALGALAGMRIAFPERSFASVGPRAISDALFSLGMLAITLGIAHGLGEWVMRQLGLTAADRIERISFSTAAGLGILSQGVLVLGLVGALRPGPVLAWTAAAGGLAMREWLVRGRPWPDLRSWCGRLQPQAKAALIMAGSILLLGAIQALTPVWDYDGLMYHLQAPRRFLQAGGFVLLPDLWQANGPLAIEMLYTIGVSVGSDSLAKLIHLAFTGLLVGATFGAARVHLGGRAPWLAAGILLGIPILPIWGTLAYADMGWAVFEFMAVAALLRWRQSGAGAWLILAGMFMGWGLGSKYLAIEMFPILLLWIAWSGRRDRAAGTAPAMARFILPSLLLGFPWYAKNWILSGNPFYPFLFGGPDWSPDRLAMLMSYLQNFGTGRSFSDYALLIWNLYFRRGAFGTYMTSIDLPSLLFPTALIFPFVSRRGHLRAMGPIIVLRFLAWSAGSQQTRFLLPLYPLLSLWAAGSLDAFRTWRRKSQLPRILTTVLVAGLVLATLAYQVIYFVTLNPLGVVLGFESKDAFLSRSVYDYPAIRFINQNLGQEDRAYFMWDGQGYYCDRRCLPDADQSRWTQLVSHALEKDAIAQALSEMGVTHLLLDLEGLNFMLLHDPTQLHRSAASFTFHQFIPECLHEVVRFPKVVLFELTCPTREGSRSGHHQR